MEEVAAVSSRSLQCRLVSSQLFVKKLRNTCYEEIPSLNIKALKKLKLLVYSVLKFSAFIRKFQDASHTFFSVTKMFMKKTVHIDARKTHVLSNHVQLV